MGDPCLYYQKEHLWPFMQEFVDNALLLLAGGRQSKESIERTYNIQRRIGGEELALDHAATVFTSTRQEIEEQWGLYYGYSARVAEALRARKALLVSTDGRYMPDMEVIPPGMDFSNVTPQRTLAEGETIGEETEPPIWRELARFLRHPRKPVVMGMSRPDPKKNITTLVKAFGQNAQLREVANLVLVMGNRDNIDKLAAGSAGVLTSVLKLVDTYDLYGCVAMPKRHTQADVPDIYRFTAYTKGVFTNPALMEPFGLTLIEAAAHGIPTVATCNGGPVDINATLRNGTLVDPNDADQMGSALLKLITDTQLWLECRRNGLDNIGNYSWTAHCQHYLRTILRTATEEGPPGLGDKGLRRRRPMLRRKPLDRTLSGGESHHRSALSTDGDQRADGPGAQGGSLQSHMRTYSDNGSAGHAGGFLEAAAAAAAAHVDKLVVIAVDESEYDADAGTRSVVNALAALRGARRAVADARVAETRYGFAILTAAPAEDVAAAMGAQGIPLSTVVFIAGLSGSEVCYPTPQADEGESPQAQGKLPPLVHDSRYSARLAYRWDRECMLDSLTRYAQRARKGGADVSGMELFRLDDSITDDRSSLLYRLTSQEFRDSGRSLGFAEELQQWLRARGHRCRLVYCQNGMELHVLPVRASRANALRHVCIDAGIPLDSVMMVCGYGGDADLWELMAGVPPVVLVNNGMPLAKPNALQGSNRVFLADESVGIEDGVVKGLQHFHF
eukprot:jgi/Mesvir1/2428/Mv22163-RA.1